MSLTRLFTIGPVLAAIATVPGDAQAVPQVKGTRVAVAVFARQQVQTGELLALSSDSLWLWSDAGVIASPLSAVRQVRIKQHPFTAQNMLLWGTLGGVASGAILTAACGSYQAEELSCGWVLPVFTLSGFLIGGLAALISGPSAYREFGPAETDDLRAFARFPQGLPPGVDPTLLAGPRNPPP